MAGPGAGAEYEHVFRWRDKYAGHTSYAGTRGPFDDIGTVIRNAELNAARGATGLQLVRLEAPILVLATSYPFTVSSRGTLCRRNRA